MTDDRGFRPATRRARARETGSGTNIDADLEHAKRRLALQQKLQLGYLVVAALFLIAAGLEASHGRQHQALVNAFIGMFWIVSAVLATRYWRRRTARLRREKAAP